MSQVFVYLFIYPCATWPRHVKHESTQSQLHTFGLHTGVLTQLHRVDDINVICQYTTPMPHGRGRGRAVM
jgi:TolB-like protein